VKETSSSRRRRMDEFAALMVTAMLLGAGFGVGWIIGIVIRRIRGCDDPDREQKRSSKERRREDKRYRRGLMPHAWQKGRFPPRVPGGQPMPPQERQQPPHQNIYLFFGPRDDFGDSEDSEPREGGPRRGHRPPSHGPAGPFARGARGG